MFHLSAIERHFSVRSDTRLCDSKPASERDVSSEDRMHPRDVQPELYRMDRMSTPHRCVVPVLSGFNAFRNCSQCRWNTATVYEVAGGPAAYFAPGAPDFAEAGDLKGYELAAANTR